MKTNKEIKTEIMQQLKAHGFTSKEVTLSMRGAWYDDIITAKIHNAKIKIEEVENIIKNYESIRRCERSGEILNGCNVYTSVYYTDQAIEEGREQHKERAQMLTFKILAHWATNGGGFDLFDDKRIWIFNTGNGETFTSLHTATKDEQRRGRVSNLTNDIADLLLQESAGWFGTVEQVSERLQREEAERIEREAKEEEERKQWQAERLAYQKEQEKNTKLINAHSTTEDIAENLQPIKIYRWANLNKNNTLKEYGEQVANGDYYTQAGRMVRRWKFENVEAFNWFAKSLMTDYEQIAGFGGTYKTNNDEYINEVVGVYLFDSLQFVVDPQGYGYARYVGLLPLC